VPPVLQIGYWNAPSVTSCFLRIAQTMSTNGMVFEATWIAWLGVSSSPLLFAWMACFPWLYWRVVYLLIQLILFCEKILDVVFKVYRAICVSRCVWKMHFCHAGLC
jgi:hypothetical protein